jgi:hypothetical protein
MSRAKSPPDMNTPNRANIDLSGLPAVPTGVDEVLITSQRNIVRASYIESLLPNIVGTNATQTFDFTRKRLDPLQTIGFTGQGR